MVHRRAVVSLNKEKNAASDIKTVQRDIKSVRSFTITHTPTYKEERGIYFFDVSKMETEYLIK